MTKFGLFQGIEKSLWMRNRQKLTRENSAFLCRNLTVLVIMFVQCFQNVLISSAKYRREICLVPKIDP